MPGASGWPLSLSASSGGSRQRAAEHALDLVARHAAGAQQHRLVETADDGGIRRRPRPRRHRRSGRCGPRDRFAHGPPWSARHGPTDWPTAPPPAPPKARRMSRATGCAGTRIATVSSPAVARSATGQSSAFGSTSVSGPGQNASASASRGRVEPGDPPRGVEVADMGDQRIEGRAGPWPGRAGRSRPHWRRRRRGRKPSRSGTRPARPRPARAPPRPRRPRRPAKSAFSGPTFTRD